jgi:hypothetical protein
MDTCHLAQTKKPTIEWAFLIFGAGTRSRTRDLLITSQLLYQLSYTGEGAAIIAIASTL